jgi:hypothetical protein
MSTILPAAFPFSQTFTGRQWPDERDHGRAETGSISDHGDT